MAMYYITVKAPLTVPLYLYFASASPVFYSIHLYVAMSLLMVSAPDSQAHDHNATMSEKDRQLEGPGSVGDNEAPPPYQQEPQYVVYRQPPVADAVRHVFLSYSSVLTSHTLGRSKEEFDTLFSIGMLFCQESQVALSGMHM